MFLTVANKFMRIGVKYCGHRENYYLLRNFGFSLGRPFNFND